MNLLVDPPHTQVPTVDNRNLETGIAEHAYYTTAGSRLVFGGAGGRKRNREEERKGRVHHRRCGVKKGRNNVRSTSLQGVGRKTSTPLPLRTPHLEKHVFQPEGRSTLLNIKY